MLNHVYCFAFGPGIMSQHKVKLFSLGLHISLKSDLGYESGNISKHKNQVWILTMILLTCILHALITWVIMGLFNDNPTLF